MAQLYLNKLKVKNDIDKVSKILSIFSYIKNENMGEMHLRPMCAKVLAYYILFGYNDDTKELMIDAGVSRENIGQITSELRKLGYIIKDRNNLYKNHLSEEMKRIKDYFLNNDIPKKLFVIEFLES